MKKGLKSLRERRLEKRVAIGPVLWDQMLLRAVVEGDMVVAERWDVPSLAWVRDGITIAEVASGIDATGDEMEALGYFSSSPHLAIFRLRLIRLDSRIHIPNPSCVRKGRATVADFFGSVSV